MVMFSEEKMSDLKKEKDGVEVMRGSTICRYSDVLGRFRVFLYNYTPDCQEEWRGRLPTTIATVASRRRALNLWQELALRILREKHEEGQ